tara:strand:+ start:22 stop:492 length:471 start_codon:yes stop_codon:yes gene_type:complete
MTTSQMNTNNQFANLTNNKKIKVLNNLRTLFSSGNNYFIMKDILIIVASEKAKNATSNKDIYCKVWDYFAALYGVKKTGKKSSQYEGHYISSFRDFLNKHDIDRDNFIFKILDDLTNDIRITMKNNLVIKYQIYNQKSYLPTLPKEMINNIFKYVN